MSDIGYFMNCSFFSSYWNLEGKSSFNQPTYIIINHLIRRCNHHNHSGANYIADFSIMCFTAIKANQNFTSTTLNFSFIIVLSLS
ncbi:hypothetical protein XELAEV_18031796mg [Xenopus laevis]|uniref:Uncharacterized protein n=1 Tax=Xenopus laevis TaxID=8355 RepID=A0A974HG03_XENLA|nr:hypothetical protein XELAEV_18031796mg [Xenopus laevis]